MRKTVQDNDRGNSIMSYLGSEARKSCKEHPDHGKVDKVKKPVDGEMDIPSLKESVQFTRKKNRDTLIPNRVDGPPLRMFNKYANDTPFLQRPFAEHVGRYHDFIRSPLVDSALTGLGVFGLAYAADKFFDPDPETEQEQNTITADYLAKHKIVPKTYDEVKYYRAKALQRRRLNRYLIAGATGLIGAGLNSWYHYVPGKPSSLWKFSNMEKKAGMLGNLDYMDINEVKSAVMDSNMTDGNKFLSMSMLDTINKPMVNSTDIVSAAVNTGVSAFGSPIGRYTVAAAADAALGYGLGKALGISAPGRLAATTGIGSFLLRTLQPAN